MNASNRVSFVRSCTTVGGFPKEQKKCGGPNALRHSDDRGFPRRFWSYLRPPPETLRILNLNEMKGDKISRMNAKPTEMPGLFDYANRMAEPQAKSQPLDRLDRVVPWERFRKRLQAAVAKPSFRMDQIDRKDEENQNWNP